MSYFSWFRSVVPNGVSRKFDSKVIDRQKRRQVTMVATVWQKDREEGTKKVSLNQKFWATQMKIRNNDVDMIQSITNSTERRLKAGALRVFCFSFIFSFSYQEKHVQHLWMNGKIFLRWNDVLFHGCLHSRQRWFRDAIIFIRFSWIVTMMSTSNCKRRNQLTESVLLRRPVSNLASNKNDNSNISLWLC